jgi:hypothetical protein
MNYIRRENALFFCQSAAAVLIFKYYTLKTHLKAILAPIIYLMNTLSINEFKTQIRAKFCDLDMDLDYDFDFKTHFRFRFLIFKYY